jgi:hypothetical protein
VTETPELLDDIAHAFWTSARLKRGRKSNGDVS